jgi:hypothetical protein
MFENTKAIFRYQQAFYAPPASTTDLGVQPDPRSLKTLAPTRRVGASGGALRPFSEVNDSFGTISSSGFGLLSPSRDAARPHCVPTRRVGTRKHTEQARETDYTRWPALR